MLLHLAIQKEALAHASVRVNGAGLDGANGIYVRDGTCDGALKFTKKGFWRGGEKTFSLYRYNMGGKRWFISTVPDGSEPGTKSDKDLYCTSTSSQDTDYPPGQGWDNCKQGVQPAPVIEYQPTRQW